MKKLRQVLGFALTAGLLFISAGKVNASESGVLEAVKEIQSRVEEQNKRLNAVKPYGYIKFDIVRDSARTSFGDSAFWVRPASEAGGNKPEIVLGVRESRIGLNLSSQEHNGIKVSGKIEGDFLEEIATTGKYLPRLRLAYLELAFGDGWSVVLGQDWDAHVNIWPITIDAAWLGNVGHLYSRRPQVRINNLLKLGDSTQVLAKAGAALGRSQDVDADGQQDGDAAAYPQVQANITFQSKFFTDKFSTLTLSGVYAKETLGTGTGAGTYESYVVAGGINLALTKELTLQGEAWTGKNVDAYLGGIGQGINITEKKSIRAFGAWAQAVYAPDRQWSVGAGYGTDDPNNDDLSGNARTLNRRVFGNVSFKPTDAVTLAAEYSRLTTDYRTEGAFSNDRVQLGARYSF